MYCKVQLATLELYNIHYIITICQDTSKDVVHSMSLRLSMVNHPSILAIVLTPGQSQSTELDEAVLKTFDHLEDPS